MATFKEYLQLTEKLTSDEEYRAERMAGSQHTWSREKFYEQHPKAKAALLKSDEGKKYRARFPLVLTHQSKVPHQSVISWLNDRGYHPSHEQYKAGVVTETKTVGDPDRGIPLQQKKVDVKLNSIFDKHSAPEDVRKNFVNDVFRTGAKTKDYDLIVTGHPHDVFGMSTDRGWTSCATMRSTPKWPKPGSGPAAQKMEDEIRNHTHCVYLVPRGGDVDKDAVDRTSYKHHTGLITGHETLLPDNTKYGGAPDGFLEASHKLMRDLFEVKPDEIYKKNDDVYNDNGKPFTFPEKMTPEHIDKAWKTLGSGDKNKHARGKIVEMIEPGVKYKATTLRKVSQSMLDAQNLVHSGDTNKFSLALRGHDYEDDYHFRYNPHVQKMLSDHFATIDLSNPAHIASLGEVADRMRGSILKSDPDLAIWNHVSYAKAKNVKEFENLYLLNQRHKFNDYTIGLDDKHSIGADARMKIVKHFSDQGYFNDPGQHNHTIFSKIFLSTKPHRGKEGIMDAAHRMELAGIHGAHHVISAVAKNLTTKMDVYSGKSYQASDDEIASRTHAMKPATRQRFADENGTTVAEIRAKGKIGWKKASDDEKKLRDIIRQAREHQATSD